VQVRLYLVEHSQSPVRRHPYSAKDGTVGRRTWLRFTEGADSGPIEEYDEERPTYGESSEPSDDAPYDPVRADEHAADTGDIDDDLPNGDHASPDADREDGVSPTTDTTRVTDQPEEGDRPHETDERRTGGGDTGRYLDNRVERLNEAIEMIRETAHELHREFAGELPEDAMESLDRFVVDADALTDHLNQQVDELRHGGTGASAVLATQSLQRDAADLRDEVEQALPGEGQSRWFRRLFKWLGKAASYLWELIAGLARPKEWSIRGEFKVVPFFAKAEMEIKFGP